MIKKLAPTTSFLIATRTLADSITRYIDATTTGSALKDNRSRARQDGYNRVIFAFANMNGSDTDFYNTYAPSVIQQKNTAADATERTSIDHP